MATLIIRSDQKEKIEQLASLNNLEIAVLEEGIEEWIELNFQEWDYCMDNMTIAQAFRYEHEEGIDIYKEEAIDTMNIHESTWHIFSALKVHGSGECSCGGDPEPTEINDNDDIGIRCNQCGESYPE